MPRVDIGVMIVRNLIGTDGYQYHCRDIIADYATLSSLSSFFPGTSSSFLGPPRYT